MPLGEEDHRQHPLLARVGLGLRRRPNMFIHLEKRSDDGCLWTVGGTLRELAGSQDYMPRKVITTSSHHRLDLDHLQKHGAVPLGVAYVLRAAHRPRCALLQPTVDLDRLSCVQLYLAFHFLILLRGATWRCRE